MDVHVDGVLEIGIYVVVVLVLGDDSGGGVEVVRLQHFRYRFVWW